MSEYSLKMTKPCGICETELPLTEYGIARSRKDGRHLYCKPCVREKIYAGRQRLRAIRKAQIEARQLALLPDPKRKAMFRHHKRTPIQKVKAAIQEGCHTRDAIKLKTRLSLDVVGDALAELLDKRLIVSQADVDRKFYLKQEAA